MPPTSAIDQARRLLDAGKPEEARQAALRQLRKSPGDLAAVVLLGYVCGELGDAAQSFFYLEKAAAMAPSSPGVWANLGSALVGAGRAGEAAARLLAVVEKLPPDEGLYGALVNALAAGKRVVEAAAWAERGLERFPGSVALWLHLSGARLVMGDAAGALGAARRAAAVAPGNPAAAAQVITTLNYCEPEVQAAAPETAASFGRLLEKLYPRPARPPWRATAEPERRLRVGFVSADFRTHACSFFFEPLIRHLDRERFEAVCYSVTEKEDARTDALRAHAAVWRHMPRLGTRELASLVVGDGVDVLVDLSGLTIGHRLPVFALKPAPVQATWLGYPGSTGLSAVDVRIVDSITDPPGAEARAVERLVRIDPCFLCFAGLDGARVEPEPPSRRAGVEGPVTFGSFNAIQKITPRMLKVWARVVDAAPRSRLAIKYTTTDDETLRSRLLSRLEEAGVARDRVVLLEPRAGYVEHLEAYNGVDVALDTFPYNGTTTTCEALWMGVPVVSLVGQVHAARVGGSLLSAVGLSDLAAADEDAFVRAAAGLAADPGRLAALRRGLRDTMRSSPLGDGAGFAARFGEAVREAWRGWCAGAGGHAGPAGR